MNTLVGRLGLVRIVIVSNVLLFLLFAVLPWLATLPSVQARIKLNQEKKINGSATFYTDHVFLMDLLAERDNKNCKAEFSTQSIVGCGSCSNFPDKD